MGAGRHQASLFQQSPEPPMESTHCLEAMKFCVCVKAAGEVSSAIRSAGVPVQ